ncbi:hypothetical protein DFH07DRAFT_785251 [Mycena maculata]|uniref:Uncharacterized protein n=1 Tax=Mycena maculata TaxID=230809 RepID=A0AAD7HD79_9AGAR|nr:hypothetical protein DFH07DRAFT_785251 [Mycena maculata]
MIQQQSILRTIAPQARVTYEDGKEGGSRVVFVGGKTVPADRDFPDCEGAAGKVGSETESTGTANPVHKGHDGSDERDPKPPKGAKLREPKARARAREAGPRAPTQLSDEREIEEKAFRVYECQENGERIDDYSRVMFIDEVGGKSESKAATNNVTRGDKRTETSRNHGAGKTSSHERAPAGCGSSQRPRELMSGHMVLWDESDPARCWVEWIETPTDGQVRLQRGQWVVMQLRYHGKKGPSPPCAPQERDPTEVEDDVLQRDWYQRARDEDQVANGTKSVALGAVADVHDGDGTPTAAALAGVSAREACEKRDDVMRVTANYGEKEQPRGVLRARKGANGVCSMKGPQSHEEAARQRSDETGNGPWMGERTRRDGLRDLEAGDAKTQTEPKR